MSGAAHLRVYRFAPGAAFEGAVVGALERIELERDAGLLDALFVTRDPASGETQAIDLATGQADGTAAGLLDFRLDPGGRGAVTQRTLRPHAGGAPPAVVEAIAGALEPGGALLAVLVAGGALAAFEDAVARSGGRMVADEQAAAATTLAGFGPQLLAAL